MEIAWGSPVPVEAAPVVVPLCVSVTSSPAVAGFTALPDSTEMLNNPLLIVMSADSAAT